MILKLWLHAWTDKAIMVSPSFISNAAEREGAWLPKSQVKELERETVHKDQMVLGTRLTLDIPQWLLDKNKQLLEENKYS